MMKIRGIVATMAARALEGRIVIGVRVARGANTLGVAVVDRELGVLRVIEACARPGCRVVTILARRREELRLRGVAGVARVVVVGLMASDACGRQCRVVGVDVAIGAHPWRYGVRASQREGGVVVIEGGVGPDRGVVAEFTSGGESGRGMDGIVRVRVVPLMTRVAERAVQRIVAADVAIGALTRRDCVGAGQLESGAGVIEGAIGPPHGIVASLAGGGEIRRGVIHRG